MQTPSESELYGVYRVMIELFVFKFMLEVFEAQTGKSVMHRCHVLLTKDNYKRFVLGLYQHLCVFPKTTSPIHAITHWFLVNLHSLQSCRLTLLRLTCVAVEPVVSTYSELEQFVSVQCSRLNMKITTPQDRIKYCLRLKHVLDTLYDTLPILVLIDKFKSNGVIDRAVTYFGVHHLPSLNEANFWDLFGTAEDLEKYLDESPKPLVTHGDSVKVCQVQEVLKSALLDFLRPAFKEKYVNCCVSELLSTLKNLKVVKTLQALPLSDLWTKEISFYQQDIAKADPTNHITSIRNNPNLCPICLSLGAHDEHQIEDCLLKDKLNLSTDTSHLIKSMMKLEIGALDSVS